MKTAYVRFISHELRTPLNSVFMGMQLSIDQIPEDTQEPVELERRETLVDTKSACGAALDILNELLLFDKLETGALVPNKLPVPVSELVEDSIKMFSVQAREKRVELKVINNDESMLVLSLKGQTLSSGKSPLSIDSGAPASFTSTLYTSDQVYVDKNKVMQVIRNVVSNAIKFTPAYGKILVNVRFEPSPLAIQGVYRSSSQSKALVDTAEQYASVFDRSESGKSWFTSGVVAGGQIKQVLGELVVEIKDSGAGISEANQKRLFNEVIQFNPELLQNGGGSGLGMCISKGIMDMHGGSIRVYSAGEGQGSVFILRLPMTRDITLAGDALTVYTPPPTSPIKASIKSSSTSLSRHRPSVSFNLGVHSLDTLMASESQLEAPNSPTSSDASGKMSFKSVLTTKTERMLRFLVVDDSPLNRKMLCRLLGNQGYECAEAEDGVQAVSMVTASIHTKSGDGKLSTDEVDEMLDEDEACGFDVILMDFM